MSRARLGSLRVVGVKKGGRQGVLVGKFWWGRTASVTSLLTPDLLL